METIKSLLGDLPWVTAINCGTAYLPSEVRWLRKPYKPECNEVQVLWFLHEALSEDQLLLSSCSVLSLPLFHIPNIFSFLWLVMYKSRFRDLEVLSYITQPFDVQLIFSSKTPASFWEPGKDFQLSGSLELCKSEMSLKLSIKSRLTCCHSWRKLFSL